MDRDSTRQTSSVATLLLATSLLLHARAAAASNVLANAFVGPGMVECDRGACDFIRVAGARPDPCHIRTRAHKYDRAFEGLADMSMSSDPNGDEPGYYGSAANIDSHFPLNFAEIEEGCTAKCNNCIFSPTAVISGPALLDCRNGRCSQFTTDVDFDCGGALEAASDSHGSFDTVFDQFVGYEGINSTRLIEIPVGCKLDCSGCTAQTFVGTPKTTPGNQKTICVTEEDCKNAGANLGLTVFRADDDYRTKGCYSKNGKAFFSRGTTVEMSAHDLPGVQMRVFCDGTAPPKPGYVVCVTEQDCKNAGADLGLTVFHVDDDYPTKGCFSKNDKAFFSQGTTEEMSTHDLPGLQQRLHCDRSRVFSQMLNVEAPELVLMQEASTSSVAVLKLIPATVVVGLAIVLL